MLYLTQPFQLFGIYYRAVGVKRYRAAGISSAASTGDNGQAAVDTGAYDGGHLLLPVRGDHHKRDLHTPVGGIRGVGYPGQTAKVDVVSAGNPGQELDYALAQLIIFFETAGKAIHRLTRSV